jgi:hypothetical protein
MSGMTGMFTPPLAKTMRFRRGVTSPLPRSLAARPLQKRRADRLNHPVTVAKRRRYSSHRRRADAPSPGRSSSGMEASRLRSAKDAHANQAGITRFGCFARRCRLAAAILALPSGVRGPVLIPP